MMEKIKNRLAKLIDVKSIITILLCAVFAYLSIAGSISADNFQTVFLMIITFYFTRRTENNDAEMPVDKDVE